MGLDVYVGTLTRYRAGDWQTSVVAAALAHGYRVNIVRRKADGTTEIVDARDLRPAPPDEQSRIREDVERWRRDITRGLKLQKPLDWQESSDSPYFTDKPDWYGFGAVLVLAAHEERRPPGTEAIYPDQFDFDHWQEDPLLQEARKSSRSQFNQLFEAQVWLPGGPDVPVTTALPWATKIVGFGATSELLRQLEDLNNRTFRGTERDRATWRNDERVGRDDPSHPFEPNARFGLSIFLTLARKAVEHRLPMLLDY